MKTFTYMEAIKKLPTCFSSKEVAPIIAKIDPKFRGQLRSTFVVLSDDDWPSDRGRGPRNKRGRELDDAGDAPGAKR